jgi:hypothetical protein
MLLKVLKDKTFFSVASNVSNKGNIKCYPIEVKYIRKKLGQRKGFQVYMKTLMKQPMLILIKYSQIYVNAIYKLAISQVLYTQLIS